MNDLLTIPNLIIVVTTIIIYLVVDNIFQKIIVKHNNITNTFLANTSKIIVILIGIFVFCSQYPAFEKSLNSLFTNSALIVAVLGFILQNTIKNIIAGLMLLSAETFKIGDRIRMPAQDITGTIEELTLRHTTLKLVTNERAIIPNSIMNESIIVNNDIKESVTSYPISIQIKIDKDIALAKQLLDEGEIEKMFGRNIPIIIHQQDFEETPIIWTKKANPAKLIKEFLDYFDGDDE